MERKFYVYVWIREDNNSVFYVGKGNGKRARNTSMSRYWNFPGCFGKVRFQYVPQKQLRLNRWAFTVLKKPNSEIMAGRQQKTRIPFAF